MIFLSYFYTIALKNIKSIWFSVLYKPTIFFSITHNLSCRTVMTKCVWKYVISIIVSLNYFSCAYGIDISCYVFALPNLMPRKLLIWMSKARDTIFSQLIEVASCESWLDKHRLHRIISTPSITSNFYLNDYKTCSNNNEREFDNSIGGNLFFTFIWASLTLLLLFTNHIRSH